MRWLRTQDGATAVLMAFFLVVIMAVGAIVIDVGALYAERRELQNGADAAVLAVAQNCAAGSTAAACDVGPQGDRLSTARTFASANASDGSAAIDPASGVVIEWPSSRATVRATSLNDGEGFVRHLFEPAVSGLLGQEVIGSTEVSARSTAIWGPVSFGSLSTLPLTFSQCEYDKFLAAGAGSATAPWTVANNGPVQTIWLQGGNKHQPVPECNGGPAGQDLPGGFGWLDGDKAAGNNKSACVAKIVGNEGKAEPGASSPCTADWLEQNVLNQVVLLPVFNDVTADGKKYFFASYAAFYVTGYTFPGAAEPGKKGPDACKNPMPSCLQGWFTTAAADGGIVDPTAPDTGVRAVQLVRD
jgi:hypothetical protein